jgi:hypothetical protein
LRLLRPVPVRCCIRAFILAQGGAVRIPNPMSRFVVVS